MIFITTDLSGNIDHTMLSMAITTPQKILILIALIALLIGGIIYYGYTNDNLDKKTLIVPIICATYIITITSYLAFNTRHEVQDTTDAYAYTNTHNLTNTDGDLPQDIINTCNTADDHHYPNQKTYTFDVQRNGSPATLSIKPNIYNCNLTITEEGENQ